MTGADAGGFLQGLISNDIAKAEDGRLVYAFLLTPQGKVIADFLIVPISGGFWLDCAPAAAADLAGRLNRYKLRAKVAVEDVSAQVRVFAIAVDSRQGLTDPRHPALCRRLYQPGTVPAGAMAPERYRAQCLALGVPDSADFGTEQTFLLECNAEELHGVDFRKGCYVGQELSARMKHRGTARKRILRAEVSTAPLPPPGTPINDGAKPVGELLTGLGTAALAMVRLDRWREAQGRPLACDGRAVTLSLPAYPLALPEEEASA